MSCSCPRGAGSPPGGGDESKKQWFIRIAGTERDGVPPTLAGRLQPHSLCPDQQRLRAHAALHFAGWYDIDNSSATVTQTYALDSSTGAPPLQLYTSPYSFQLTGGTAPFNIVFHSSSLDNPISCGSAFGATASCFDTVLIYQVCKVHCADRAGLQEPASA